MLELLQGRLLQVENQVFGQGKPLKIRDLERCKNSQGREKYLGKNDFGYMAYVRRQDVS
jgi:hypothetical protein